MVFHISVKTIFLNLLCLVFALTFGFSQNKNTTVKDSLDANAPKSISTINLIEEIEVASEKIKNINRKLNTKSSSLKIDSLFPNYKKFIAKQRIQTHKFISENPNKQKANNLLNEWGRYHDYIKAWEKIINSNIKRNSLILEDVVYEEKTWELTYAESVKEKVPNEILAKINAIKNDYTDIKNSIVKLDNNNLILESRINRQLAIATDAIEQLETLKTSNVYHLFHKRHLPLWKTSFKNTNDTISLGIDTTSFSTFSIFMEFFKTFEKLAYLFFFLVVLLIFLFRYLKKGFDLLENNEASPLLNNARHLIYKQYQVVIVFSCLLLAIILFPNLPSIINDIIILLLLAFTIPIVNFSLIKKFKKFVFVVIIFFVFDSLKTYVWFSAYLYRIYLLFEAIAIIAVTYYFTHPYLQSKKLSSKKIGKITIKLILTVYFLAFLSIISNVLGYTNLTDIALKICIQGTVISIVFYAILRVAHSISAALLHRHFYFRETMEESIKTKIEHKLTKSIRLVTFTLWLAFFLQALDLLKPILNYFGDVLSEPHSVGSITFTLGKIASFLLILIFSFLITRFISFILDNGDSSLKFLNLPKGIPAAISVILRYLILGFGIVFAISSLGVDLSQFNLMAGALGLGIGFGLQNIISNFVSGLILIFERPILQGDTVEVNNLMGTVSKIGIRSSKVSTFDGADVVVPNNNLVSNDLINWSLSNNIKRIEILVGTSYSADPNQVLKLLLECANSYPDLITDPAPKALFSDFGDSSLNFRLRFWVHLSLALQAKSDVSITIYNKFKAYGIEIPFPQQDIYIKDLPVQKNDLK